MKHRTLPLVRVGAVMVLVLVVFSAFAQTTGTIEGKVTDKRTGDPLPYVNIVVKGTTIGAATNVDGRYEIKNLAPGTYTLVARLVGHETQEVPNVVVDAGKMTVQNIVLAEASVQISEMTVYGASRRAERITEAPAAISTLAPKEIQLYSATGQLPRLLEMQPGVDIVQSGVNDFNINTRGFNSSLNRRLLVLLDGRDLAIAFLGSQEWNGFPIPLEDIGRLELVRGPGSALYGPNAFNGVINITTPAPKDIQGTKLTYCVGELALQRADVRYAGVLDEHFSIKANAGRVQSGTWTRSRAHAGPYEYPGLSREARALNTGDVTSMYFNGRVDYEFAENILTAEGGFSEVQNEVYITGIGRVQVTKAHKPWGRINFINPNLNVMFWAQGRKSVEPQYSLASGAPLDERSGIVHGEVQYNFSTLEDQVRVVLGASHRYYHVNTRGTLMKDVQDDNTSGIFGQVEYTPFEWIKLVGAARWDRSTLHADQWSPKGAIVWTPHADHTLRVTFNEAFQVPNYSEFFLRVAAGTVPPTLYTDPRNPGQPVPILARGNDKLTVEKIEGYEVGYKGIFFDKKLFVTVDGYFNRVKNFVTDLLQGVNPQYPYNPPAGLAEVLRRTLPGLTIVDGKPAVVVSYTNAGKVDETGVEVGFNYYINDEVSINGNWTWYDFKVKEQQLGDVLLPNAPKHKFAGGILWTRPDGIDLSLSARNVQPYPWAAGVFAGPIRAYTLVNGSVSYRLSKNYRVGITVTNMFDNRVYQLFGGSVIGRQAIASVTATF
ncbi:MAG: hypothetical protein C4326_05300 [Ignavibacteria bacterium]|mgnify:FL=1